MLTVDVERNPPTTSSTMAKLEDQDEQIDYSDNEKDENDDTWSKYVSDNDDEASNASDAETDSDDHDDQPAHNRQPPQNNGRAARFKRFLMWSVVPFCIWLFFTLRKEDQKPQVIYASRYSKEHKYRPAASPIITETLRDGRIRIRGGNPTATPVPTPTSSPRKKKRTKRRSAHKAKKAHRPW